ncbi:MAG TPA: hypothetical protein ENJ45_00295, partial [Phaeodactylibacter sp.]|nr:hypothetical protein [Phaeodactylibacter sp.]
MTLSDTILKSIEGKTKISISHSHSISGGDISDAFLLQTDKGQFFLKLNDSPLAYDLFQKETMGLALLSAHINTPKVISYGKIEQATGTNSSAFLLLEYIKSGYRNAAFWQNLGRGLATLHQVTAAQFGLDHNNYIGRLPQSNNPDNYRDATDWSTFYRKKRLQPQVKMAYDRQLLPAPLLPCFDKLYHQLPELCPIEKPTLIHGDLWSGNFMVSQYQKAYFIDPSVCYAHREMDLAMALLFGGFDERFYSSYEEALPVEPNFSERVSIYQLYYLLVHLNLFGKSYLGSVERIV